MNMDSLLEYYLHQAGRGSRRGNSSIGPIYYTPPFIQRGRGIGDFFGSLFRWLKPIVFSDATRGALRTIGKEALRTGGRVLADMADNTDVSTRDIVSKQLGVAAKNLVTKMRGGGTR